MVQSAQPAALRQGPGTASCSQAGLLGWGRQRGIAVADPQEVSPAPSLFTFSWNQDPINTLHAVRLGLLVDQFPFNHLVIFEVDIITSPIPQLRRLRLSEVRLATELEFQLRSSVHGYYFKRLQECGSEGTQSGTCRTLYYSGGLARELRLCFSKERPHRAPSLDLPEASKYPIRPSDHKNCPFILPYQASQPCLLL